MTAAEIIAELEAIAEKGRQADGWATMEELLVAALPRSEYSVRKMVRDARRAGRLQATRVPRENVEGTIQHVIGYRITSE